MPGDEQLPVREPMRELWRPRPEPVYDPRIVPIVMPDLETLERVRDALRALPAEAHPKGQATAATTTRAR